tara:strand:- start:247 stop:609 length:363 start_codon:yes stop_codon:yes gene_type:complete
MITDHVQYGIDTRDRTLSGFVHDRERRGKESNLPRSAKRTDSGFEDRGDHQAPITLRRCEFEKGKGGAGAGPGAGALDAAADFLDDGIEVREFTRLSLRVYIFTIDIDLEYASIGGYQFE